MQPATARGTSTGAHSLAVDAGGRAHLWGHTWSSNFPTTPGAFKRTFNTAGHVNGFVAKVSPDGAELLASTFLDMAGEGIALDSKGDIYLTGDTIVGSFPVTPDAYQKTLGGIQDATLLKLSGDCSQILYATFFGGKTGARWNEAFRAIALDPGGNICAGGWTDATDWPVESALQDSPLGGQEAVVVKFSLPATGWYRRGDASPDGVVDLADILYTLDFLYLSGPPFSCQDVADANDDGAIDISDVVRILFLLFGSLASLPDPFLACGPDPTPDALDCGQDPSC